MELSQPIIAYFAMGNYRVGSSRVYTHSLFLCRVIHSFTAEWTALCVSSGATERFSPVNPEQ